MPQTNVKRLVTRTEDVGKLVLSIAAVLFVLGLLVENMHLGRVGLANFGLLRPRPIMVGLPFCIYILLPVVCFAGGCLALRAAIEMERSGERRWLSMLRRVIYPTAVVVLLFITLPMPFNYYLDRLYLTQTEQGDFQLGRFQLAWAVWRLYINQDSLSHVGLFYLPAFALVLRRIFLEPSKSRKSVVAALARLWWLLPIGVLSFLRAYTADVYPLILYFAGGGSPRIVYVGLDMRAGELAKSLMRSGFEEIPSDTRPVWFGPLSLELESEEHFYFTPVDQKEPSPTSVVALPKEKIIFITYVAFPYWDERSIDRYNAFVRHQERSKKVEIKSLTTLPATQTGPTTTKTPPLTRPAVPTSKPLASLSPQGSAKPQ